MAHGLTPDAEVFRRFVDKYRSQCLWFLRADYYPQTSAESAEVLRLIEQHGDRQVLRETAVFRQWLSHRSSETSAAP